jgi:hypothetical protein
MFPIKHIPKKYIAAAAAADSHTHVHKYKCSIPMKLFLRIRMKQECTKGARTLETENENDVRQTIRKKRMSVQREDRASLKKQ